ncbi:MAG: Fur family transcriptional regulator [Lachnospiraceae bacterium]|nr:Fur family transcriptional regulator [Lachnospiraceae bacterium]
MNNMEHFKELLKSKGLKMTTQRALILESLSECPKMHLTAEEIYEIVCKKQPEIGIATVYRTLKLLTELGLIDTLDLDDGFVRYELAGSGEDGHHHHHHLICISCGKVLEFKEDLMETLEGKIEMTTGFKIYDHEVKMYGYCKECKEKMNK